MATSNALSMIKCYKHNDYGLFPYCRGINEFLSQFLLPRYHMHRINHHRLKDKIIHRSDVTSTEMLS